MEDIMALCQESHWRGKVILELETLKIETLLLPLITTRRAGSPTLLLERKLHLGKLLQSALLKLNVC
jgi:hypothetical protein